MWLSKKRGKERQNVMKCGVAEGTQGAGNPSLRRPGRFFRSGVCAENFKTRSTFGAWKGLRDQLLTFREGARNIKTRPLLHLEACGYLAIHFKEDPGGEHAFPDSFT